MAPRLRQHLSVATLSYGKQTIAVMANPEATRHLTHHYGIVKAVTVADHVVDVELVPRTGQPPIVVRFSHTFDPLLAERAANLTKGMTASVSVIAWTISNGVVQRRDGRSLS